LSCGGRTEDVEGGYTDAPLLCGVLEHADTRRDAAVEVGEGQVHVEGGEVEKGRVEPAAGTDSASTSTRCVNTSAST
jgi:hypothetical protein